MRETWLTLQGTWTHRHHDSLQVRVSQNGNKFVQVNGFAIESLALCIHTTSIPGFVERLFGIFLLNVTCVTTGHTHKYMYDIKCEPL